MPGQERANEMFTHFSDGQEPPHCQLVTSMAALKLPGSLADDHISTPTPNTVVTPTVSPRRETCDFEVPPAPKMKPMPLLMKALMANSTDLVQQALAAEPDAASLPFWDHAVEPPLCFAVRNRCNASVMRLLLQHGADPDATDTFRRGPVDHLESMRVVSNVDSGYYPDIDTIEDMLDGISPKACAQGIESKQSLSVNQRGVFFMPPCSMEGGQLPSWANPACQNLPAIIATVGSGNAYDAEQPHQSLRQRPFSDISNHVAWQATPAPPTNQCIDDFFHRVQDPSVKPPAAWIGV